jgi:ribonuclease HI
LESLFKLDRPYGEQILAKCEEIRSLLEDEIESLQLPFSVCTSLNDKNIYHGIIAIEYEGKRCGGVNVWFSPKKNSYKITTDISKDEMILEIYKVLEGDKQLADDEESLLGYHIFTDGSFNGKIASYAFVILKDGQKLTDGSGEIRERQHRSSFQVIGEFMAVIKAIEKCEELNITDATFHYDLDLIGKIATNTYKAKAPVSQFFLTKIFLRKVNISWNKVKAHSGNKWNEYVDKLASSAFVPYEKLTLDDLLEEEFGGLS